jgi:hypothetical protein
MVILGPIVGQNHCRDNKVSMSQVVGCHLRVLDTGVLLL